MSNNLDIQYQGLLKNILENGTVKRDRTGTGTKAIFGNTFRHKMAEGFPILTTKKVFWKGVVAELIWFLRGSTNIQWLCQNDVNVWVGDCYKRFISNLDINNDMWKIGYNLKLNSKEDFTQDMFIDFIKNSDTFAEFEGELGPVYGKQWRAWETHIDPYTGKNLPKGVIFEIDQIKILLKKLKEKPDDRRLIVSAWNAAIIETVVLPPCHYSFQCYTRELSINERMEIFKKNYPENVIDDFVPKGGMEVQSINHQFKTRLKNAKIPEREISILVNIRSWDTFLGGPFNIASYGLLLCMLAKEVNMYPGELIINSGDTHIYLNHLEAVEEQLKQEPLELPTIENLWLNTEKDIFSYEIEDIKLTNYHSQKSIKAPLSN